MTTRLHLVFAINDDYIHQLRVLWSSLFEYHDKGTLHVHVLHTGLSAGDITLLKRLAEPQEALCDVHEIPPSRIEGLPVKKEFRYSPQYHRLFLGEFLSPEVTRVLYLDTDTLVCGNLTGLVDSDLHGCAVGAVEDLDVNDSCNRLGLPPSSGYFNSGVLLIDMHEWINQDISTKALAYLTTHRQTPSRVKYPDQDALNTVLQRTRCRLPAKWNTFACYRWFQPRELSPQQRAAILDPGIVHFIGPEKPWLSGYAPPYQIRYLHHAKRAGIRFPFSLSFKAMQNRRRQKRTLESMRRLHLAAGLGDDF